MEIVNMNTLNEKQIRQAAQMLADELPMGWATIDEALDEIRERLIPENTLLAAVDNGEVLGWCGILPSYGGNVFELHPLVVAGHMQRKGIGAKLVNAAEEAARERGGITLWLGADDKEAGGETSFANVDLYDNLPERIRKFDPGTHQTAFYLKMGFSVVGVMPDANGIGKPDIYMAKRLRGQT
jgi:aminoglycoside 6'-N-acetyltransferase I